MSNFVTEDDKRIRDCQDYGPGDLLPSDYFVTDRPGSPSARRQTVQRLLNILSANGLKQRATSGTTNPDNASGVNGDFYYKIPLDASSIALYEKAANVWTLIFLVPLTGGGGSAGVPSREKIIGVGEAVDLQFLYVECTGSERPISILNVNTNQTLDFTYEAPNIYAAFPDGDYTLSIIVMGTPSESDPPLEGIVSNDPNTFTFTPSDEI